MLYILTKEGASKEKWKEERERKKDGILTLTFPNCSQCSYMIGLGLSKNLLPGTFCHLDLELLTHSLIQNSLLLLTPEWISCSTKLYRELPGEPSSPTDWRQWRKVEPMDPGKEMTSRNETEEQRGRCLRESRGQQLLLNK